MLAGWQRGESMTRQHVTTTPRVTPQVIALLLLFIIASFARASDKNLDQRGGAGAGPVSWADDLTPITTTDWSHNRAAHLLERAGFGGTPEEIDRLAVMTPEAAVRWFVQYQNVENNHLPPFDESGIFDPTIEPFPKSREDVVRIA